MYIKFIYFMFKNVDQVHDYFLQYAIVKVVVSRVVYHMQFLNNLKPFIIILILIERSMCPNGVRIVGQWCSTSCTEVKETLYSVPIWLITLCCIL